MNSFTTVLMPFVRHGATALATYLVTKGVVDGAMQETVTGFILAGVSITFSLIDKHSAKKAIETAKKA